MRPEDASAAAFRALNLTAIIAQLSQTAMERLLEHGLSMAGFGVLNHFVVRGVEGQAPASLARAFQVTKGAMTNTLQRLEAMGYVSVESDARDGRAKIVRLTKAGRAARTRALAALEPELRALLKTIPGEEFAAALPFLERLKDVLDAARD